MSSSTAKLGPNNAPEIVPGLFPFKQIEDLRDRRLELINSLQSTLDLQEQLAIFQQWLHLTVRTDSVGYHHKQQQIAISLGSQQVHSCNYRLNSEQEYLGEIEFTRSSRFSDEDLSQIETALTALLYPVRNALRYHDAIQTALRDPLTGTGNRIALDNALRRECQLAERYAQSVSLLVLDIDFFKHINDNHGHLVGDQVLQEVAQRVRGVTRETDMTFRYGGEEFVVVLSKTDINGAGLIAERIRQVIAQTPFAAPTGAINVTISIGAASLCKQDKIKDLFDRADQALYKAKSLGRNQVIKN